MSFRKELLPQARAFYEPEIGRLSRPNSKGWSLGNCPFHKSKSQKSFGVSLDSGAFFCHGCHAKGGDIVSFLRQRDGLSFKEACQRLGCWAENGKPKKVRPGPLLRYLWMDFTIDDIEYHAEVPDEPKTELEWLRRSYAEAADRLGEIHRGDSEKFEGEEEVQWGILASSWELIQMEGGDGRQ
jgi:hypothetical protein